MGAGQIVVHIPRKGDGWEIVKGYLSLVPGIQMLFDEFAARGYMYNTTRPSSRWPGTLNHKWYTLKVMGLSYYLFNSKKSK